MTYKKTYKKLWVNIPLWSLLLTFVLGWIMLFVRLIHNHQTKDLAVLLPALVLLPIILLGYRFSYSKTKEEAECKFYNATAIESCLLWLMVVILGISH